MYTPAILKFSHYLPTCLWRWNRQSVPKRRHIKFRRWGITQKKTYNKTQKNFTFLGLVAAILNWGHKHYNRSYMNPIQVKTAYNLYAVTPQPKGRTNTLTNCICTPCFYIRACHNIVINFCSTPTTRLKTVDGKQTWYFALSWSSYFWHHTC